MKVDSVWMRAPSATRANDKPGVCPSEYSGDIRVFDKDHNLVGRITFGGVKELLREQAIEPIGNRPIERLKLVKLKPGFTLEFFNPLNSYPRLPKVARRVQNPGAKKWVTRLDNSRQGTGGATRTIHFPGGGE